MLRSLLRFAQPQKVLPNPIRLVMQDTLPLIPNNQDQVTPLALLMVDPQDPMEQECHLNYHQVPHLQLQELVEQDYHQLDHLYLFQLMVLVYHLNYHQVLHLQFQELVEQDYHQLDLYHHQYLFHLQKVL